MGVCLPVSGFDDKIGSMHVGPLSEPIHPCQELKEEFDQICADSPENSLSRLLGEKWRRTTNVLHG